MVRLAALLGAAAALVFLACGGGDGPPRSAGASRTLPPASGAVIAALAPLPGGGLRYGELASGVIRDLGSSRVLARVPVRGGGQQGLLGLAVDGRGRTFSSSVEPGGRLVVDQLLPVPRRRVWTGPRAARLGNGGHLALLPGSALVIGVGDLGRPSLVSDPAALNGKLLALEPSGGPAQRPRVLSSGWNNPFAFATTRKGQIWVADNAPGRRPERIGSGVSDAGPRSPLGGRLAPSGLAVLSAQDVAVCGVASGTLERYRRAPGGAWSRAGRIAGGCRFGVARLSNGALVVSTDAGLRRVRP